MSVLPADIPASATPVPIRRGDSEAEVAAFAAFAAPARSCTAQHCGIDRPVSRVARENRRSMRLTERQGGPLDRDALPFGKPCRIGRHIENGGR